MKDSLHAILDLNPHEIIVVDGGSTDATVSVAHTMASQVIKCKPERARQMNAGAEKASGNILLFMHADSKLTRKKFLRMKEIMTPGKTAGGAFSLKIESEKISLKVISLLATWRAKYLNIVYGDQAIFVRNDIFQKMGGFSSLPICEDLDFFRRLRQQGETIILQEKIHISARRWNEKGFLYTTLLNITIGSLFLLGFSPQVLKKWYSVVR